MKKLTLVTLSAALVIGAILASGGTAKTGYSITCTATKTTLTWAQRTTGVDYAWSDGVSIIGPFHIDVTSNGAGHKNVSTPPNSVTAFMSVTRSVPPAVLIPAQPCT